MMAVGMLPYDFRWISRLVRYVLPIMIIVYLGSCSISGSENAIKEAMLIPVWQWVLFIVFLIVILNHIYTYFEERPSSTSKGSETK